MHPNVSSDLLPGDADGSIARHLPVICSAGKLLHLRQPVPSCVCASSPQHRIGHRAPTFSVATRDLTKDQGLHALERQDARAALLRNRTGDGSQPRSTPLDQCRSLCCCTGREAHLQLTRILASSPGLKRSMT